MEAPFTEIIMKEMDDTGETVYVIHLIKGIEIVTEAIDGDVCYLRIPGEIQEERFFPRRDDDS